MRILLTGASGFIGRQAVPFLLARGHGLRLLCRRSEALPLAWRQAGVELLTGDLSEPASLAAACVGMDQVWHLAGLAHVRGADAAAHARINRDGSLNLGRAAAAAGVARFLFLSTAKAVGDSPSCQDEALALPADTAYGRAKREAEDGLLALSARGELPAICLRPPLVYGPGVAGNLGLMLSLAMTGRLPPLPRLTNRRSLIGATDLLHALEAASRSQDALGQALFVTDGEAYSTTRIESALRQAAGLAEPRLRPPTAMCAAGAWLGTALGAVLGRSLPFDRSAWAVLSGNAEYDAGRARALLAWRPEARLEDVLPAMGEHWRAAREGS